MPDLTDISDTIERAAYARLMGENHNPEDAHKSSLRVFAETAARAVAPLLDAAEALDRVKALHYEVVVYELDPANGYAVYVDDERKVLGRFCAECSSVDLIDAIEDGEYRQGWDYGREVDHPCLTLRTIDGETQP